MRILKKDEIFIVDESPHWIKYFHKNPAKEFPKADGKWVLHGTPSELETLANNLRSYIKNGSIQELKYRPTPNESIGPYASMNPVICVYPRPDYKDYIKKEILNITSLENIFWQSEENTELLKLKHKRIY